MSYRDKDLEPRLADFLDELAEIRAKGVTLSVEEMRKSFAETGSWPSERILATDVKDIDYGRLYLPEGTGNYPLLVFFHGGGWTVGSVDVSDGLARQLCVDIGCGVLSVEYPLAPEHPYPAALDYADEAIRWAIEHADELECDPARVGVGGSSSGGNLATAACLRQKDTGFREVIAQLLIYPVIRREMDPEVYANCLDQDLLYFEKMALYWEMYAPKDERYTSVIDHPDHSDLPPAVIVLAEHDPLMAEGQAYVKKLEATGVKVYEQIYKGMIHAFLDFPFELSQTALARENIALAMKRLLGV